MEKSSNLKGKIIIGSFLIFLGIILILENNSIFNFDFADIIFRWESILIVLGIILLVSKSNVSTGIILTSIGIFFIVMDSYDFRFGSFFYDYWPILIILIGIYVIYKRSEEQKEIHQENNYGDEASIEKESSIDNEENILNRIFVFSEESIHLSSPKFSLCDSFFFASSLKLFFRNDQTNKSILLDNTFLIGSIVIYIPSDWRVIDRTVNILGEIKDRRKQSAIINESPVTIVLKGVNFLSSIKIKEL